MSVHDFYTAYPQWRTQGKPEPEMATKADIVELWAEIQSLRDLLTDRTTVEVVPYVPTWPDEPKETP